ncbi:hypothetical protein VTN77DRAFT_5235 [Rasamsonia byssochlamydoides]|uniref:uncharacterized protein n=1 Tax=Rasamsonia byssochlamydoides TaxID=89139 RepID=UPI003743462A
MSTSSSSWPTTYSPLTRTTHTLRIAVPIPTDLLSPIEDVIPALHNHANCISLQALTSGYREVPTREDSPAYSDPYFTAAAGSRNDNNVGDRIKSYLITEGVVLIPGIGNWGKKFITFPAWFMDTERGLRTRADAPMGVRVWAEWRVEEKHAPAGIGQAETQEGTQTRHQEDRGTQEQEQEQAQAQMQILPPDPTPSSSSNSPAGDQPVLPNQTDWLLTEVVTVECARWMMPLVRKNMADAHREICEKIIKRLEGEKRGEEVLRASR